MNKDMRPFRRDVRRAGCRRRVAAAAPIAHPTPRARCRGSVYLAVLGAAMLVALIGVSGVLVNRVQYRTAGASREAAQAGFLAQSAVELAIHRIANTSNWRTTYLHDTWTPDQPLGAGTVSFKLLDTRDASLSDDSADGVRIVGRGKVGQAMRMSSVELTIDAAAPAGFRVVTESWQQLVE